MSRKKKTPDPRWPKPKNMSGLRPWKPGQSGNPAGRPKSITLSEAYRHKLEEICPDDPEGRTWADVIAEKMVRMAMRSVSAASEVCDRVEGKAPQHVELSRENEPAPPQVLVRFVSPGHDAGKMPALPQPDELNQTFQQIESATGGKK